MATGFNEIESLRLRCEECNGSGIVYDRQKTGAALSSARRAANIQAQEVAERMGISKQYISLLEKGKVAWTPDRTKAYIKALKAIIINKSEIK